MKRSAWRYLWKSEDIRKKLLFTLLLLVVYRFAANVPVPGVNRAAIGAIMDSAAGAGNLLGMLDLLSGGTISNFSILAMGVYPYITAQIILQLLVPIIPALERKMKENQREGQKWMERWTVILTVPMALLSAIGQINIFNSMSTSLPLLDFTFGLKGGYDAGIKLVSNVKLFSHLANVGDTRSLVIHPASTTHRQLTDEQKTLSGAGPDVVRLSIGIEDVEDLISIGTIGLIKAINTFDESRGTRLATYAARCIENEVLMHLRNLKKTRAEVSLYDPIGFDKEGNEISLMDVLFADNDILETVDIKMLEERTFRR